MGLAGAALLRPSWYLSCQCSLSASSALTCRQKAALQMAANYDDADDHHSSELCQSAINLQSNSGCQEAAGCFGVCTAIGELMSVADIGIAAQPDMRHNSCFCLPSAEQDLLRRCTANLRSRSACLFFCSQQPLLEQLCVGRRPLPGGVLSPRGSTQPLLCITDAIARCQHRVSRPGLQRLVVAVCLTDIAQWKHDRVSRVLCEDERQLWQWVAACMLQVCGQGADTLLLSAQLLPKR